MSSPETPPNAANPQGRASLPAPANAVDSYRSAILDIAEAMDAISPEISPSYRERLMRLHGSLSELPVASHTLAQSLDDTRQALHEILRDFAGKARHHNQVLARDLNQTLDMMARTEDSRSVQYVERLVDFADQVETAIRAGDLQRLERQTSDLRGFAESIELHSHDAFARLREKLTEIQHRLHEAELLATLDPLTGVANRRELDRELASRVGGNQEFCILLFDLDGFKAVNDHFGHLCGDEVLKQVAARLSGQVRARDFVCRWGGDEFVAILACEQAHAETRSRQIAARLNGPYRIAGEGHEIRVDVAVSVGLAQYIPGESVINLFRRVDESMYRHKDTAPSG
ncbi:MAG TPA: GGDEF domain-containing protein [Bryobacteraceae bacterium]|nr:GGDEF domain-containing protein [Bryobacteraceae bacterium]